MYYLSIQYNKFHLKFQVYKLKKGLNNMKNFIKEYKIDYEIFTTEEVVNIINFFKLVEKINDQKKYDKAQVISDYNNYRNILKSKTLEKKYDKMLEEVSQVSIYHTMMRILS